tara:strand:+ start:10059 stop:11435 length:1377 start_codon:yes stop_codon:yes gene_type:complete
MVQVAQKQALEKKDITSLGLFDSASPNFNTYYPDITKEDLNPDTDNESFIHPIYRALSEVIVHREWNPIDFSANDILKNSMGMLRGQTVYTNHEMVVGNELGVIEEVAWQEGYTTQSGVKVPAGANVKLKIDGKSNPKIARGMMMSPPSIHSVSVTVSFEWERSHDFEDENVFFSRLGQTHEDGEMIRRVVTGIQSFHEISTVHHGADPFAQRVNDNGEIVNPEYANRVSNSTVSSNGATPTFNYDYALDIVRNSMQKETTPAKSINNNTLKMKKELLALCTLLNISTEGLSDEATVEKLTSTITELKGAKLWDQEEVDGLIEEGKTELKVEVTELTASLKTFNDNIALELSNKKDEVVGLLNKIHNNKPAEVLLTSLEKLDETALNALSVSYTAQFDAMAPLNCEDCGSSSVSRRASAENGDPVKKNKGTQDFNASLTHYRDTATKTTSSFMDSSED